MLSINDICLKARAGTLTCSEVLDIMMNQATVDEKSHAQLHLLENFQWNPTVWKTHYARQTADYRKGTSESDHINRKQNEWAPAGHLTPKASQSVPTYSGKPTGQGLHMDESRLAASEKYNSRTGHDELPKIEEKTGKSLVVLRLPENGKGKPTDEKIQNPADAKEAPYKDPKKYVQDKSTGGAKVMERSVVLQKALPVENARPPHSMFPDSESMTLHLTAAFLSDAGIAVLDAVNAATAGLGETFGIHSRTAAAEVRKLKNSGVTPEMVLRTRDTDAIDKRKELPTHSQAAKTIDHVVVILRKGADGNLHLVTAYPSDVPSDATKTAAPNEDVEELGNKLFKKTAQVKTMPKLTW